VLRDDHEIDLPDVLADLEVGKDPGGHAALQQVAAQAGEERVLARDGDGVAEEDSTVVWVLILCRGLRVRLQASGGSWPRLSSVVLSTRDGTPARVPQADAGELRHVPWSVGALGHVPQSRQHAEPGHDPLLSRARRDSLGKVRVEWASELHAADWILDHVRAVDLTREAVAVTSLVPEGFAAYARVLHPASAGSLEFVQLDALIDVLAGGTSSHESCWFGIWEGYGWMRGFPAYTELQPPAEAGGRRPAPSFAAENPRPAPTTPRLTINDRDLALYHGSIDQAKAFCNVEQSPNLWWPDDRAWCVATEIDFSSTYLGGSDAVIEKLLHDERLEAIRVDPTDRVTD
jgi:hypothetical protein